MSHTPLYARLALVVVLCLLLPGCKSKVTKANFDKVTIGMSLEEVEKILGKGAKETGTNTGGAVGLALPTTPTVGGGDEYKWESNDHSITITFRQGKVVHKRSSF